MVRLLSFRRHVLSVDLMPNRTFLLGPTHDTAVPARNPETEGPSATSGEETNDNTTPPQPHSDERQVHLDTERSFVLYPICEYCYQYVLNT